MTILFNTRTTFGAWSALASGGDPYLATRRGDLAAATCSRMLVRFFRQPTQSETL